MSKKLQFALILGGAYLWIAASPFTSQAQVPSPIYVQLEPDNIESGGVDNDDAASEDDAQATRERPCGDRKSMASVLKPLSQVNLDIRPRGVEKLPADCYREHFPEMYSFACADSRCGAEYNCYWEASGLWHNPLYFEDAILERYGQSHHPLVQPVVSGAKFFGSAAILPYKMGLDLPREREYTLGYYRPGNCVPPLAPHLPWSWRGALMQTATVGGAVFLFPVP